METSQSIDELLKLLADNPGSVSTVYKLAQAFIGLGEIDNARAHIAEVRRLAAQVRFPQTDLGIHLVGSLLQRAMSFEEAGQHDQALKELNYALQIHPKSVEALRMRGYVFASQGRIEESMQDANQALEIDPTDMPTILMRGEVLQHEGKLVEAIWAFDDLLNLSLIEPVPDKEDSEATQEYVVVRGLISVANLKKAGVYIAMGLYDDAKRSIEDAQEYQRLSPEVYEVETRMYLAMRKDRIRVGQTREADKLVERVLLSYDNLTYVLWHGKLVGKHFAKGYRVALEPMIQGELGIDVAKHRRQLNRQFSRALWPTKDRSPVAWTASLVETWNAAMDVSLRINDTLLFRDVTEEGLRPVRRYYCVCGHEDPVEWITGCLVRPAGNGVFVANLPLTLTAILDLLQWLSAPFAKEIAPLVCGNHADSCAKILAKNVSSHERLRRIEAMLVDLESSLETVPNENWPKHSARVAQRVCIRHECAHVLLGHFDVEKGEVLVPSEGFSRQEWLWCSEIAADAWALAQILLECPPAHIGNTLIERIEWWRQMGWEMRLYAGLLAVRDSQVAHQYYPSASERLANYLATMRSTECLGEDSSIAAVSFAEGVAEGDKQLKLMNAGLPFRWPEMDVIANGVAATDVVQSSISDRLNDQQKVFDMICQRLMFRYGIYTRDRQTFTVIPGEEPRHA